MRLSVTLPHGGPLTTPDLIREFAIRVEDMGFGGLGFFDHLALPRSVNSEYTLGPQNVGIPDDNLKKTLTPLYEIVTTMAYVAGITKRVMMTTGILVLPLRNPVYNARQLATIDALSGGRLTLGIGVGWLKEEADMMQMPWDKRGARTDDHIELMRTLWNSDEEYVSYKGEFYEFEEIDPKPHPVQRPIPILIGGHAPAALKRTARLGDGWISSHLPPEKQEAAMEEIRTLTREYGRNPDDMRWACQWDVRYDKGEIKNPEEVISTLKAYRDLGATETGVRAMGRTTDDMYRALDWLAKEVLPEFPQEF